MGSDGLMRDASYFEWSVPRCCGTSSATSLLESARGFDGGPNYSSRPISGVRVLIKFLRGRRPSVRGCTEKLLDITQPVRVFGDEGSEVAEPISVLGMRRDNVGGTRVNPLFVWSQGHKRVEKKLGGKLPGIMASPKERSVAEILLRRTAAPENRGCALMRPHSSVDRVRLPPYTA